MKKNLFVVAAVALLAFTACNKEEFNYGAGAPIGTIEFVAGFDVDTKTTLKAGKTEWVAGDEISINGVKFVAQNDGPTSTFLNAEEPAEDFGAPFTAIYPYDSKGNVPSDQTAHEGNFDPKAVVEIAESDNHELSFKNKTSLLKFQVPTACKTVELSSETELATGSTSVTITGDFKTGTDYYVAVLPGDKKEFKVKVDGYVVKSVKSVTIGRSSIIQMALPYNIYLHAKTSKYDWTSDGARFATWTWGTGVTDSWFDMVKEDHDGVYRLEVPEGYANLIYCRLDGGNNVNEWENVWNQTGDLTIPTDNANHFYISDSGAGAWGDKDYTFPVVKPKDGYLYLRPSSEWLQANAHFAAWIWKDNGAGKVYNFKPHESVPGLYELNLNGANKMILFRMDPNKKVTDGSTAWPGDNHWYKSGDLKITGNLYTVVGWQAAGTGFSTVTEF